MIDEEDWAERLRCEGEHCYDDDTPTPEEPMSADSRTVATDALTTLGTIIDETAGRDAIHLAVEPVISGGVELRPGEHVGRMPDGTFDRYAMPLLGIVDPFLRLNVHKGERFWLVVYPRQITSLRHVWTHPGFPETVEKPKTESQRATSEKWLRNFLDKMDISYHEAISAATSNENQYDYLVIHGEEASGQIPPEFYDHVEVVTGKKITNRATHFSCSC